VLVSFVQIQAVRVGRLDDVVDMLDAATRFDQPV
jgi:hypothetical protein